ncbi:MAG: hypothetical protein KBG48_21810 [Kofleriaceae bacterium]|jgi:hypothetical protein|nr:hypothetical protein [Kofleriaceae bacterium]MBP9170057.1 hypothetical protein [Kofleriaceae bacterium]MBP9858242.1 hypothetical protein [Kofleriaceae bacterium]
MRRALALTLASLAVAAAGCRVAPPVRAADHPARADAPGGRLAGPPPSLGTSAPTRAP